MPPERPVPQIAGEGQATAVMPPDDLPAEGLRAAKSVDPGIPDRVNALLDMPGAPWQPLARPLLAAVHATGHRLWLAGGAARDLVAGVPESEVNDLDLSGTAPPGRFTDITYQTMRAWRMSEYRTTITPDSLVCAVVPPRATTRLIEYRGLTKGGFEFPAVGSTLTEDARYRDFSLNALLYDVLDHDIYDPTGTGLDDLLGDQRRLTPTNISTKPLIQAKVILRAAKFALRWKNQVTLDLAPLFAWIAELPDTLCQRLTIAEWNGLSNTYRRTVSASREQQLEFAATLPEPGRELIITLIGSST